MYDAYVFILKYVSMGVHVPPYLWKSEQPQVSPYLPPSDRVSLLLCHCIRQASWQRAFRILQSLLPFPQLELQTLKLPHPAGHRFLGSKLR